VAGVHLGVHLSVSEVSIKPSHHVPAISFINQVVLLEHAPGLVSSDGYDAKVIDPSSSGIRHAGMPKVIKRCTIDSCVALDCTMETPHLPTASVAPRLARMPALLFQQYHALGVYAP
jgi:hypothetical protein